MHSSLNALLSDEFFSKLKGSLQVNSFFPDEKSEALVPKCYFLMMRCNKTGIVGDAGF